MGELLDGVRTKLNALAEGWSEDKKNHCLEVTEAAFKVRWAGSAAKVS